MTSGRIHPERRSLWLLLFLLSVSSAAAHDMWIVPPASAPAVGELVEIRLRVGHGGESSAVRRDPRRILRFAAFGPEDAEEVPVPGIAGADPAGLLRPAAPGLWAVIYESGESYSELAGKRFESYLEEEGLAAVQRLRRERGQQAEPGRELYSRSLKSLLQVGEAAGAHGRGAKDRLLGLPLELVAESGLAGGELTLRLYLRGEPLAGALVDLRRLDEAEAAAAERTGVDGRVRFDAGPGAWVAAVVHMEEADAAAADWRSIFATLTFTIGGQDGSRFPGGTRSP